MKRIDELLPHVHDDTPDDDPNHQPLLAELLSERLQFRWWVGLEADVRCKERDELVQRQIADRGRAGRRDLSKYLLICLVTGF
jgi:hypothetical protein